LFRGAVAVWTAGSELGGLRSIAVGISLSLSVI
jgi:hypothetical protein